jgi:hypothetical protein
MIEFKENTFFHNNFVCVCVCHYFINTKLGYIKVDLLVTIPEWKP